MENDKTEVLKQLCTITIVFPVRSDDEAIDVKKKVGVILSDLQEVRIDFRIISRDIPPRV